MSPIRFLKDLRFWLFYNLMMKKGVPLVTLGEGNQWTLCEAGLNSESKILSAGAGHNITFEKELIARYGCKVVLLDPSPTGIATMREAKAPSEHLHFMEVGLAGRNGILNFQKPEDAVEGSFREATGKTESLQFQCKSLSTLMSELAWQQIDLLKFDIEGHEYSVIQELLDKRLPVKQMCVEFHYGPQFANHSRGEMVRNILALRKAGYDLIHHINHDHTFLRRSSKHKVEAAGQIPARTITPKL